MFGFADDSKNNSPARKAHGLDRLSQVITWDEKAAVRGEVDNPRSSDSQPAMPQAATSYESAAAGTGYQALGGYAPVPLENVESKQDKSPATNEIYVEKAAKQIVDVLLGTVSHAMEELRPQAASDHAKLEATAENVTRIFEEMQRFKSVLTALAPKVDALGYQDTELRTNLTTFDERLCREETALQWTQDRLTELSATQTDAARQVQGYTATLSNLEAEMQELGARVEALDGSLRGQTEAAVRLNSLCGSLEQAHQSLGKRLDSQDQAIRDLCKELRKRGALLDRFLASFRSLDLRREVRFPVDKAVQVVVSGERETVVPGRILNVSENGLGLTLEAPAPVGSKVQIDVDGKSVSGSVSHCKFQGGAYSVGLTLTTPLADE